ncbi:MAG: hypothetical protein GTO02_16565 [Candidatus Dadabacteria bacterium]|nr:hypothetical protein [Candidatus Dadabacteria bacterium]
MGRKVISGFSGKMGRLFIEANEFCAEDWEIEEIAEEHDTTNTCSAGVEEVEFGVKHLEGTINYTWDVANNPWDTTTPNLGAGTKHGDSKLYLHAASGAGSQDGPFFQFGLAIQRHRNSIPVKGKVTGVITFRSYGTYTLPTGHQTSDA